ncbi:MAG: NAD(P)-binding domain-containing protein [Acidimicrobiia bacterium]
MTSSLRVGVAGVGAVGSRVVRRLLAAGHVVVVDGSRPRARGDAAAGFGDRLERAAGGLAAASLDAAILAAPSGDQPDIVTALLGNVPLVVSTADSVDSVRQLLAVGDRAAASGTAVVVGSGFAPGLSCLLASRLVAQMDEAEEIHIAKAGTGGPACARQHHRALGSWAFDWRDGEWIDRPGGSGRELCWFPEPFGARDCYRAELPDPLLLVESYPSISRVTSRMAANRRDRFTTWLPMLTPPHPEGAVGAIRVEVRGRRGVARVTEVMGVVERPAVAAAAMAAAVVLECAGGVQLPSGSHPVATIATSSLLNEVAAAGVTFHRFAGTENVVGW